MQFLSKTNIDFLGKRGIALAFSALLLAASVGTIVVNSFNFGIDFTGGTLIELG